MNYTNLVATKIAGYGADKMDAQGYKIEAMKNCEGAFYCIKPAGRDEAEATVYLVTIRAEFTNCTCPFFAENAVCKHVVKAERQIAEDARLIEQEQAWQDWADMVAEHAAEDRGHPGYMEG